jgi:hypothetical protein
MVALVFVYLLSLHSSWLTILKQIGATHCKLSVELMVVCTIHHFHFAPAQHLACTFLRVRFSSWSLTYFQHSSQVIAHTCTFLILSRLLRRKNYALCVVIVCFFNTLRWPWDMARCAIHVLLGQSRDIGAPSD